MSDATVMVHWPGKSVAACDRHRQGLERIADAMGFEVESTPIDEPKPCPNCEVEDAAHDVATSLQKGAEDADA